MTEPTIIRGPWLRPVPPGPRIELEAERAVLRKRRWRGAARDGTDFGFDLEVPLTDQTVFFAVEDRCYVIAQKPEPVLKIALHHPAQAARVAWSLGNLHFPIQVKTDLVMVVDDPAVRLYLERDKIVFSSDQEVFHPIESAGHHHHHGNDHGH
jgi:urease accessory protein